MRCSNWRRVITKVHKNNIITCTCCVPSTYIQHYTVGITVSAVVATFLADADRRCAVLLMINYLCVSKGKRWGGRIRWAARWQLEAETSTFKHLPSRLPWRVDDDGDDIDDEIKFQLMWYKVPTRLKVNRRSNIQRRVSTRTDSLLNSSQAAPISNRTEEKNVSKPAR